MKLLIEILLKHIEIVSRDSYCIVLRTAVYSGSLFDFQKKGRIKIFFYRDDASKTGYAG